MLHKTQEQLNELALFAGAGGGILGGKLLGWRTVCAVEWDPYAASGHVLHPDLVPWERKESASEWQAIYIVNGKTLANGEPGDGVYSSKELLANADACSDKAVQKLRGEWSGSRVAG